MLMPALVTLNGGGFRRRSDLSGEMFMTLPPSASASFAQTFFHSWWWKKAVWRQPLESSSPASSSRCV